MKASNQIPQPARLRQGGFTLIELMIAVAVAAILASIAYPTYQNTVQRSRRFEAKLALLDLATRQERYYTTNNAYANSPDLLGYPGTTFPVDVLYGGRAYYQMNVTVDGSHAFSASAVPIGPQVTDVCGGFVLDNLGKYGNTVAVPAKLRCW